MSLDGRTVADCHCLYGAYLQRHYAHGHIHSINHSFLINVIHCPYKFRFTGCPLWWLVRENYKNRNNLLYLTNFTSTPLQPPHFGQILFVFILHSWRNCQLQLECSQLTRHTRKNPLLRQFGSIMLFLKRDCALKMQCRWGRQKKKERRRALACQQSQTKGKWPLMGRRAQKYVCQNGDNASLSLVKNKSRPLLVFGSRSCCHSFAHYYSSSFLAFSTWWI